MAYIQSQTALQLNITASELLPEAPTRILMTQTTSGIKVFYWTYPIISPTLKTTRLKFNSTDSKNWDDAHFIIDLPYETFQYETGIFRKGTYTILVKGVDIDGNESEDFASLQLVLSDEQVDNLVETIDFKTPTLSDPPRIGSTWTGTLVNMEIDPVGGTGDLVIIDPTLPASFETLFTPTAEGDLKLLANISGNAAVYYQRQFAEAMYIDDSAFMYYRLDNEFFYGQADNSSYILFPSKVKVYTEAYSIKVVFAPNSNPDGRIMQLKVIVDAPDIVTSYVDVAIGTLGARLAPSKQLSALKLVNITLHDGSNTKTATITDKDPVLGALVQCYDANGVRTSCVVDAFMMGY